MVVKLFAMWMPVVMSFSPLAICVPYLFGGIPYPVGVVIVVLGALGISNTIRHLHERVRQVERQLVSPGGGPTPSRLSTGQISPQSAPKTS